MPKVKKSEHNMTLLDHLIELRNRLLLSFCVFLLLFFLCFIKFTNSNQNLADIVYNFLQAPLASQILENGGRMIYTALHEGFFTQVKVAFFISMTIAFPILLIQLWKFIAPGLYKNEKRAFLPYLIAIPILFFAGGSMVYYIISPIAWSFFLSYQNIGTSGVPIRLEAKMGEYLSLMMRFIFAFGLAFQLPVVLSLMARVGLVTHESLRKFRKYAIVIAFLAAAFLTPPDPFSQISLALPIIILYEISIYIAKLIQKKKDNK